MRKWILKSTGLFLFIGLAGIFFLTGCGDTGSTTTGAPPVAVTPTPPVDEVDPLPEVPTETTPGLPNLTGSAALALTDNINYTGLTDIAGNIVTPIVGDPQALLKITNTRDQSVEGTLLVSFEDKLGFWGADMTSVPKSGVNTSQSLDILFTDNALTFRVVASRLGDNLLSTLYYRVRQSGETQCLPVKCYFNWAGQQYEVPFNSLYCPIPEPDVVGTCRNYMNPTDSAVKVLGTFSTPYSGVAVLPAGN